jgi:hypothetical protein
VVTTVLPTDVLAPYTWWIRRFLKSLVAVIRDDLDRV